MTATSSTMNGGIFLGPDIHANRPSTALGGALYVCTTHNTVDRYVTGTGWGTYATLTPPGGTTGQALVKNSGTDYDVAWGTVSGGGSSTGTIIAQTEYNPGTLSSYTIASTTIADVDATNLAVTFTAPSSGKVRIRIDFLGQFVTTASPGTAQLVLALRESSTTVKRIQFLDNETTAINRWYSPAMTVTGLTSGSSHTYKLAWLLSSTANSATGKMFAGVLGSNDIPVTLTVHALP